MEEENKVPFELVPIVDANTKKYVVARYEELKKSCEEYIKANVHDTPIETAEQNKAYKDLHAEINKKIEVIGRARIDISKLLIEDFENQCKELETMLSTANDIVNKHIKDWKAKNAPVVNKIPTKTLTIKVNETAEEMKKLAKVQAFAEKLGLVVVVK